MKSKGSDRLSIQIKQGRIKFRMTVPFIEEIQDPNFSYKVYRDTYKEKYINNLIGRINYCLQINKSDKFKEYIQFLKNQININ